MARQFVPLEEPLIEEIAFETPRTSYRALLVLFNDYLRTANRKKAFKLFCYGSIPTKNWDNDIEDWIIKLEQSRSLSLDHLEILCTFLKCFDDSPSKEMLRRINQFQYQSRPIAISSSRARSNGKLTPIQTILLK